MNIEKRFGTENTSKLKNRKTEYISIHYSSGHTSKKGEAYNLIAWFNNPTAGGSADYVVDDELFVQYNGDIENRYCHAVGGGMYDTKGGKLHGIATNKNCISIEICSNNTAGEITYPNDPRYYLSEKAVNNAIELTKYLMVKYGIPADHVIRHYDVNGKPCPGVVGWNLDTGDESKWKAFKAKLSDNVYTMSDTQAKDIIGTEAERAEKILDIAHEIAVKYGVFPSVAAAQTILESGYCSTDLAIAANNVCGLKCFLSGNTWPGSTWDGASKYTKLTKEQDKHGNEYEVKADFRAYKCVEDSIADRCAYLIGARNNDGLRYKGIQSCSNYIEAIYLIKAGGYATDVNYAEKIVSIIERFKLDRYDHKTPEPQTTPSGAWYVQAGYFEKRENAQKLVDNLKAAGFDAIIKEAK